MWYDDFRLLNAQLLLGKFDGPRIRVEGRTCVLFTAKHLT